jgi:hypothetical protein
VALSRDIRLKILAETREYQRRMAEIPGITEKQAASAAVKMERQLVKAQVDASKAARKAATESASAWRGVGEVLAGNLGADALKGIVSGAAELVTGVFEARTELINLSRTTGIAANTLAAISVGAEKLGKDGSEVTDSFRDFGEVLFDFAATGGGRAEEAIRLLGIQVTDANGNLRDQDQVLREVLDRMPRLANETERVAVAQQFFGDAGLDLIAILENQDLASLEADAARYGRTLDDDAIRATQIWNASLSAITGTIGGVAAELADLFMVADGLRIFSAGVVTLGSLARQNFQIMSEQLSLLSQGLQALGARDVEALRVISARIEEVGQSVTGTFQEALDEGARFASQAASQQKAVESRIQTEFLANERRKKAAKEAADAAKKRAAEEAKAERERAAAQRAAEQAARKAAAAERARAREAEQRRKEAERSLSDLNRLFADTSADQLTEQDKVNGKLQERLMLIEEVERTLGASAATDAARDAAKQRAIRDTAKLEQEAARELESARNEAMIAELERIEEVKQARRDAAAEALNQIETIGGTSLQIASVVAQRRARDAQDELDEQDELIAHLEARRGELEQSIRDAKTRTERQALRQELRRVKRAEDAEEKARERLAAARLKAWRGEQAAAIGETAFQGGIAAIKAYALFGPPPSPPGIAAAAAAATLTAAQIGLISSEKPPQFHTGFSGAGATFPSFTAGPDERVAVIRNTEPVLNQRAAEELGRETIDELNRTGNLRRDAGDGGGGVMELNFERRQIDAMVVRTVRAGGRLRDTIARIGGAGSTGRRNVFAR